MTKLESLLTYEDFVIFLMERVPATDRELSLSKPGYTKSEAWDYYLELCLRNSRNELPDEQREKLYRSITKDFK